MEGMLGETDPLKSLSFDATEFRQLYFFSCVCNFGKRSGQTALRILTKNKLFGSTLDKALNLHRLLFNAMCILVAVLTC